MVDLVEEIFEAIVHGLVFQPASMADGTFADQEIELAMPTGWRRSVIESLQTDVLDVGRSD